MSKTRFKQIRTTLIVISLVGTGATARYLAPEPLLQSPYYVRRSTESGMSVPTYSYALNNPLAYVDPNGLKVNLTGIRSLQHWDRAVSASGLLSNCSAITSYFKNCLGTNPWTNSSNYEFVLDGETHPDTRPGITIMATTNYWTNTTTLFSEAFLEQDDAELGGTIAHELAHQVSISTFDGIVYLGASQPTGRCSANAFERLAKCVLTKGCAACSANQCESSQGVQFGPEMSR